jgi:hypothetical protein
METLRAAAVSFANEEAKKVWPGRHDAGFRQTQQEDWATAQRKVELQRMDHWYTPTTRARTQTIWSMRLPGFNAPESRLDKCLGDAIQRGSSSSIAGNWRRPGQSATDAKLELWDANF